MLEKIFKLKQNNTTVKTEILAGLTTFMTMAYIIALNPNLLTGFGAEGTKALWNGVFPVSYTHLDVYKRQGLYILYPAIYDPFKCRNRRYEFCGDGCHDVQD